MDMRAMEAELGHDGKDATITMIELPFDNQHEPC